MESLNQELEVDFVNCLQGKIISNKEKYFEYNVYEQTHEISHQYWGAYIRHNKIRREIIDMDGEVIGDESVCENNALMMYEPLLDSPSM